MRFGAEIGTCICKQRNHQCWISQQNNSDRKRTHPSIPALQKLRIGIMYTRPKFTFRGRTAGQLRRVHQRFVTVSLLIHPLAMQLTQKLGLGKGQCPTVTRAYGPAKHRRRKSAGEKPRRSSASSPDRSESNGLGENSAHASQTLTDVISKSRRI